MALPPLLPVPLIRERLLAIFPEGMPARGYCTREIAARTVFVMLYLGAVAGRAAYARPDQVTRMSDRQAGLQTDEDRRTWSAASLGKSAAPVAGRWYAANTREPIRDETLRAGLMQVGAVLARTDLPTTSSSPRYALAEDFAALFDPAIAGEELNARIHAWRAAHLTAGALARIKIVGQGAAAGAEGILVSYPGGETRRLAAGPSSHVAKAVVEQFAPRFLARPAVAFLSESRKHVISRDEELARSIGLMIARAELLPDIVLVDLDAPELLLVFVEIVATDGPITPARREALRTTAPAYADEQFAFVTAYADRASAAFRRTVGEIAWNSFIWFASEPEFLMHLIGGRQPVRDSLHHLIRSGRSN